MRSLIKSAPEQGSAPLSKIWRWSRGSNVILGRDIATLENGRLLVCQTYIRHETKPRTSTYPDMEAGGGREGRSRTDRRQYPIIDPSLRRRGRKRRNPSEHRLTAPPRSHQRRDALGRSLARWRPGLSKSGSRKDKLGHCL